MKIAVFGNSNSILQDGWLPSMQENLPKVTILNFSLGGSRSPALTYQLIDNIDSIKDADQIIIEPTVLDCGEKASNGAQVSGQALAFFEIISDLGIPAILLALPRYPEYIENPSNGMQAWAYVAKKFGASVINGSFILNEISKRKNCAHHDLWRDNHGHHISGAARIIGKVIAEELKQSEPLLTDPRTNLTNLTTKCRVIRGKTLAEANGLNYRSTASSLMAAECAVLRDGDLIRCHLKKGERILGVAVNYGEMNATQDVFLEARGEIGSKRINFSHSLLPSLPTRKTRILFRATEFPSDYGDLFLSDCVQNTRFQENGDEHFEVSGILIGQPIDCNNDWESGGAAALHHSDNKVKSIMNEMLTNHPQFLTFDLATKPTLK